MRGWTRPQNYEYTETQNGAFPRKQKQPHVTVECSQCSPVPSLLYLPSCRAGPLIRWKRKEEPAGFFSHHVIFDPAPSRCTTGRRGRTWEWDAWGGLAEGGVWGLGVSLTTAAFLPGPSVAAREVSPWRFLPLLWGMAQFRVVLFRAASSTDIHLGPRVGLAVPGNVRLVSKTFRALPIPSL